MICLRVDVDYPYSNRWKSFACVGLGIKKPLRGYLKNCHDIANLINNSNKNVKTYWFFTSASLPDEYLVNKLSSTRHEIGLHVVNDPFKEVYLLEKAIHKKVQSYTIHGTERVLGQILWGRRLGERQVKIPVNFPLKNFHNNSFTDLDVLCYSTSREMAYKVAKDGLSKGYILHFHPDWLFQTGTLNHRAACFWLLEKLLLEDD